MDTDTLAPGTMIGRYSVARLLGKGGMGAVYEATHVELQKRVAVKLIHPQFATSPEVRARFVREGQAASRIRHPHVVDVYDVGLHGDTPYLVMEFLEGEDLSALLAREKRLALPRLVEIMIPVLSAVAAAHDLGIVHRDLKPENVHLCWERGSVQPKVLDFGISKLVEQQTSQAATHTSALLGTPLYMSPEQAASSKTIDHRADQYSLGVILYELGTGRRPFEHEALYLLLHAIVQGEFPPPRAVAPDLPPEFEQVVLTAMARTPQQRFESVRALGRALLPFGTDRIKVLFAEEFGYQGALSGSAPGYSSAFGSSPALPVAGVVGSTSSVSQPSVGTHPGWVPAGPSFGAPQPAPATGPGLPPQPPSDTTGALSTTSAARRSKGPVIGAVVGLGVLVAGGVGAAVVLGGGETPTPTQSATGAATPPPSSAPAPSAQAAAPSAGSAASARVMLSTTPAGATVTVGGKRVGVTPLPLEVPSGGIELEVTLGGHEPVQRRITPSDGQEISIPLAATPAIGRRPPGPAGRPPDTKPPEPKPGMPKLAPR
ncbi:MAG: protein kinase [Polyangiaceae bacterium]|nr:protein kinase [Polyangiaceae bacterium]